jgi:hypothetical protein
MTVLPVSDAIANVVLHRPTSTCALAGNYDGGIGEYAGKQRVLYTLSGLEVFVNVTNGLNRPNTTRYGAIAGASTFGVPIAAAAARRVEVGLDFRF